MIAGVLKEEERLAKEALLELEKHGMLCNDEQEVHIFTVAFIMGLRHETAKRGIVADVNKKTSPKINSREGSGLR